MLAATIAAGLTPLGWVLEGQASTIYQASVEPYAKATITLPENALFYIQASSTPCVIALLGGCHKYAAQKTKDLQSI
jgi:hypothetical protein